MALIGYARVSTEDQTPLSEADELRAAGCRDIHEEQASGASRSRPVLARVWTVFGLAMCCWSCALTGWRGR